MVYCGSRIMSIRECYLLFWEFLGNSAEDLKRYNGVVMKHQVFSGPSQFPSCSIDYTFLLKIQNLTNKETGK